VGELSLSSLAAVLNAAQGLLAVLLRDRRDS